MVDRFICTDDKPLEDEPFRYTIYSVYKIEKTECNRQFHNAYFLYFVCVLCSTDCVSLDKSSRNSATKSSISSFGIHPHISVRLLQVTHICNHGVTRKLIIIHNL